MCVQFAPAELERFLGIKKAFDPPGLLNPGKAVPTLARCAEFGKMHVHHGELPPSRAAALLTRESADERADHLRDRARPAGVVDVVGRLVAPSAIVP